MLTYFGHFLYAQAFFTVYCLLELLRSIVQDHRRVIRVNSFKHVLCQVNCATLLYIFFFYWCFQFNGCMTYYNQTRGQLSVVRYKYWICFSYCESPQEFWRGWANFLTSGSQSVVKLQENEIAFKMMKILQIVWFALNKTFVWWTRLTCLRSFIWPSGCSFPVPGLRCPGKTLKQTVKCTFGRSL